MYFDKHIFFCLNERAAGETCCANFDSCKLQAYAKDKIKTDLENKFNYEIENTSRSVGTRLSHHIYKKFGNNKLDENRVNINVIKRSYGRINSTN